MHEATPLPILAGTEGSGKGLSVATITEDSEGTGYFMVVTHENNLMCEFSTHATIAKAREWAAKYDALVVDRTLTETQLADQFFYGF